MVARARIADSDIRLHSDQKFDVYGARNIMYGAKRTISIKELRKWAKLFGVLYEAALDHGMVMRRINIRFTSLQRAGAYGRFQRGWPTDMTTNSDRSEIAPRLRRDLIEIRMTANRSWGEMISTFAHEMIHAEQHERGWLKWTGGRHLWEGEPVKMRKNMSYLEYINLPWEHDAFSREHQVARSLVKRIQLMGLISDNDAKSMFDQIGVAERQFYFEYRDMGGRFVHLLDPNRFS